MRIDAFELDCTFRQQFTLAEVLNGQAAAFQAFRIRNVRGNASSWLHLSLELDGKSVRQKSVRNLSVGDEESAAALERGVLRDMVLHAGTPAGPHTLRLLITGSQVSQELLASITVLPPDVIPTDFLRARLLSAYVQLSDPLRNFAAEAIDDFSQPRPAEAAARLYEALLSRKLLYQPVSGRQYPDCQRLSAMDNILCHGGSCADLSLLFASLLWNADVPPALLLFEDHMAAGCFPADLPAFETLDDPALILQLAQCGTLLPWEATSACHLYQHPFETAQTEVLQRIRYCAERKKPCMLLNVQRTLMQGLKPVPANLCRRSCTCCGYVAEVSPLDTTAHCPACGKAIPPLTFPDAPPAPEPVFFSDEVVYSRLSGGAAAVRLKADTESLRLMDTWQGLLVTEIGERAFAKSRVRSVALPEGIVRIGDYAFAACKELQHFILPDTILRLGTGSFRDSGLQALCIPGSIKLIPRLAFAGCTELEHLTLSEGVTQIDEKAFDGCCRLQSVTIPASVRQIARSAFPPSCRLILLSKETKLL